MPLFQLLISCSVFCPFGFLLAWHVRAALAGHLQPRFRKHYSNTSPNLILHVQTCPPVTAELLSFSPIPPLLVGILSRIPISYNIVLYPTPATVLLVRYIPCTVVPEKWKGWEVTWQLAGQEAQEGRNERQRRRWMGGGGMMRSDMTTSQTRGIRGAHWEAVMQWEVKAQVDRRWQRDESQRDNQPDKRRKRGAMRGGSAMRGRGADGRKAAAWRESAQQSAGQEAWEGCNERRQCNERRRWRRDKRWCNNQPDKRHDERRRRKLMGGGSMTRGDATTSRKRGVR